MKQKKKTLTEEHFEIKKSSLKAKGVGLGLFSKVIIKKGSTVGYYTGNIYTDEEIEKNYCYSDYILWVCKDFNILGEGKNANYTRYINHSYKPNVKLVTSSRWKTARFETIKSIQKGEELFFDYGKAYWENADVGPI